MFSSNAASKIAEKKEDFDDLLVVVDLKLDARLKPLPVADFQKKGPRLCSSQRVVNSFVMGKTYAIGSACSGSKVVKDDDDQIYYPGDMGLFGCVFEAWKNHWVLRTSPDDWWFPIACKIAKAVDEAAKPRSYGSDKVRKVFVNHEGKENICIDLPIYSIHEANYDSLFAAFGSELESRIKVPAFVQAMQNDFSTSGPAQKIASQINLMASLQEFFTYEMGICGCGLRGLEMLGSVADWENLAVKLQQVRETLKPIQNETGLYDGWWDRILQVFQSLAKTRKDPNDRSVSKFWINILMDTTGKKWVGGGGSMPGRPVEVKAYNGWLISFLTDRDKILAEDIAHPPENLRKQLSGWNSVPMKVSLKYRNPVVEEESTLVAGMIGYVLHYNEAAGAAECAPEQEQTSRGLLRRMIQLSNSHQQTYLENVPSVQPHHMWAMMLPPNSPARD